MGDLTASSKTRPPPLVTTVTSETAQNQIVNTHWQNTMISTAHTYSFISVAAESMCRDFIFTPTIANYHHLV